MNNSIETLVLKLWDENKPVREITDATGLNSSRIYKIVKEHNRPLRGKGSYLKARWVQHKAEGTTPWMLSKAAHAPKTSQAVIAKPIPTKTSKTSGQKLLDTLFAGGEITQADIDSRATPAPTPSTSPKAKKLTPKQYAKEERYRRIRKRKLESGLSDEKIAREFDVSIGTVRKAQGKK